MKRTVTVLFQVFHALQSGQITTHPAGHGWVSEHKTAKLRDHDFWLCLGAVSTSADGPRHNEILGLYPTEEDAARNQKMIVKIMAFGPISRGRETDEDGHLPVLSGGGNHSTLLVDSPECMDAISVLLRELKVQRK